MSGRKGMHKKALKVITPEILFSNSKINSNKTAKSVSAFVRDRRIMPNAREISQKNRKARKQGISIEKYPALDPIWRKYQNSAISLEDFDLSSCENDEMLFELGKEIVEQAEAAEMAPDGGIPICPSFTLPRSFLLDAIHFSASMNCLNLQRQAGKLFRRSECPSPIERAKLFDGYEDRYVATIKTLFQKTKKKWLSISNVLRSTSAESSEDDDTDNEFEPCITSDSSNVPLSYDDPDFDTILKKILDMPEILEKVTNYDFDDCNEFGADALWSFDTSSLLAFGILAEEFISSMIDAHLEYNNELEKAGSESENEDLISEGFSSSSDISFVSSDGESIEQ